MSTENTQELLTGLVLKDKVEELKAALLERHPRMPVLLREIHSALLKQPENVTLLEESEIAVIVSGLKIQTDTEFASIVTKAAPSATKKLKNDIKSLGAEAF
jgi:hypothetical protein